MEFNFDVNALLPNEITVVDNKMLPFKNRMPKDRSMDDLKRDLSKLIDSMGIASCKAQGLKGVITSGIKIAGSDHHLYLLKDGQANNGKGAVVGMIKVGFKRLFVIDIHYQQLEVNPLCVLDFYVHENRQRNGCGLRLFKAMLEKENAKPEFLAYDRPSSKFLNFLRKHFDLQKCVHQMNNYTVFTSFFHNLSAVGYVPGNRRFISSAPIDSRLPSMQEKRQISSANSSDRRDSVCNASLSRYRGVQPTEIGKTASAGSEMTGLISSLPPRPPCTQSKTLKDMSWSRRNGSNLPFARDNRSSESPFIPGSSPAGNIYSRHTHTQQRSQTINQLSKTSPLTGQHSVFSNPQNIASSNLSASKLSGKTNTEAGLMDQRTTKSSMSNSNQEHKDHNKEGNLKTSNAAMGQSYSINNMYRQTVSLASSNPGTSWNIFGVDPNPRRSASKF